jgi:hypothetical protein
MCFGTAALVLDGKGLLPILKLMELDDVGNTGNA